MTAGFVASLAIHALMAYFLFSLVRSALESQSPETIAGAALVSITREAVPHARVVSRPRPKARPRAAAPHPRILHVLAHFAPTAPPNPTPAPVASQAPNPIPTAAQLAVKPAPLPATAPTVMPLTVAAAAVRVPPTVIARALPTASPSPAATLAPAPAPGPKTPSSPGPPAIAPVKAPASAVRPIQTLPSTPRPAPRTPGGRRKTLASRLRTLIPTAAPAVSPEPNQKYSFLNVKETPPPEPTPPPAVLAATKFLFVENPSSQRWKQSYLGTSPEERYVKMYVTSVKRIGFINWCRGWVLRAPLAGSAKWIVEPDESLICGGHLEPFTPPSPEAAATP